jgi:hypothetical protein
MTREELNKELGIPNEIVNNEVLLTRRFYVEVRLIADALIEIKETLNADGPGTLTDRISSISASIEDLGSDLSDNLSINFSKISSSILEK